MRGSGRECSRGCWGVRAACGWLLLVALGVAGAWAENAEPPWQGGAAVLVYHQVLPPGWRPWLREQVTARQFAQEMEALRRWHVDVLSLAQFAAMVQGRRPFPPRAALVTFDDGSASVYRYAYPVLVRLHLPAVVFVIVSRVRGEPVRSDWPGNFLSWQQLEVMARSRLVAVESHTFALHFQRRGWETDAGALGWLEALVGRQPTVQGPAVAVRPRGEPPGAFYQEVVEDLRRSRAVLARHLGIWPEALAWPYGAYTSQAVRAAREAGFRLLFTTRHGLSGPGSAQAIPRVTVFPGISLARFRIMLETGR